MKTLAQIEPRTPIATNTTLDITRHRSRRELPADFGPANDALCRIIARMARLAGR